MKMIKNLGIKTLEGFEVKNLQRFPSMEWGPEGGLQADIYFKGKQIGTVYNDGNGGMSNFYETDKINDKARDAALKFLQRADQENYGETTKYSWLKEKQSGKNLDEDDWEALVLLIEERHDFEQYVKRQNKKGFIYACAIDIGFTIKYLSAKRSLNESDIRDYYQNKNETLPDDAKFSYLTPTALGTY